MDSEIFCQKKVKCIFMFKRVLWKL